jgi:uncharacterized protein
MEIPVFPLNTVLFPGSLLALKIFEQRYLDMLKGCIKNERPFGVFLIREGAEVGAPAVPFDVGCLAQILNWEMPQLGVFHITTLGKQKVRIVNPRPGSNRLLSAQAEVLAIDAENVLAPEYEVCARVLRLIIQQVGAERFRAPFRYDDARWVSYRLSELLPLDLHLKQRFLELESSDARLALLLDFLRQQGLEDQGS